MKLDNKKEAERQRWHRRMSDPNFREAERRRSLARRKEYMKNPEFRAKWNVYRRKLYRKQKEVEE